MSSPCAECRARHDYPVALGQAEGRIDARTERDDLKTAFVAAYSAGFSSTKEGGKGRFGGVNALDLVDVCGVYGGCQGAEEESFRGEGGGYGVCV